MNEITDDRIVEALMFLARERGVQKTFCPSEVARRIADDWRPLMPEIRRLARTLPLEATQQGVRIDPVEATGPIRLSLRDTA